MIFNVLGIVITPDMTTVPSVTTAPGQNGNVIIIPEETESPDDSENTTSSGVSNDEIVFLLEEQNQMIISIIILLGAILGCFCVLLFKK